MLKTNGGSGNSGVGPGKVGSATFPESGSWLAAVLMSAQKVREVEEVAALKAPPRAQVVRMEPQILLPNQLLLGKLPI